MNLDITVIVNRDRPNLKEVKNEVDIALERLQTGIASEFQERLELLAKK